MNDGMMERNQVLDALSALASGTRLDLVRMLIAAGDEGRPAGAIARDLGIAAPRLSFHLAALEQAGLITARREGRNVIYAADHARIGRVIGYLLHDCCAGDPKVGACCRASSAGPVTATAGEP